MAITVATRLSSNDSQTQLKYALASEPLGRQGERRMRNELDTVEQLWCMLVHLYASRFRAKRITNHIFLGDFKFGSE